MKTSTIALAIAAVALSTPAAAQLEEPKGTKNTQTSIRGQSGSASSKSQEKAAEQQAEDKLSTGRKVELSREARPAIVELQTAVNARDTANIPAKLAAAQAAAKTADDRHVIALLQTKAATDAGDLAGMRAGIDALRASGIITTPDLVARYNDLAKRYYDAKQYDQSALALDAALAADANNVNSLKMLASLRDAQGRGAEAASLMARAIAAAKASGTKPKESDYKFAAKVAYDSKASVAGDVTRAWLADYPSPTNWRDSLRIYRHVNNLEGIPKLDLMRLARAANALNGEMDYFSYINELVVRGYLNEAKSVLDEAIARKAIDPTKAQFRQFASKLAKAPSRAVIDSAAKAALAKGGRDALEAADTLYGIGAYAEAVPLYRAAIAKGGIDTSLANLHLGMALARSGDKAGATAAFNAVSGPNANIAKYWLIWLGIQA